jgi:16S rRNA C967 or C1407 C5-methylase (RsmB/RsmF family)
LDRFERYRCIIDDYDAFKSVLDTPLPRTIWASPLKRSLKTIHSEIEALCPSAVPLAWREHAWRLPHDTLPGSWLLHVLGTIYAQEEAAMLAGVVMSPKPGERVLDLCAAPGGKSVQMAMNMMDRGNLVLNEKNFGRLGGLRGNVKRMGITCATINHDDGLRLIPPTRLFDRVLVDAPCTCEGTSRKASKTRREISSHDRDVLIQVQVGLLRKALNLVKPGGRVVYSTCTYAPEENEGVLHRIRPDQATVEPITLPPGIRGTAGLRSWGTTTYRADIQNSVRLWPHHNNTGGFFIAKLRRL